MEMCKVGSPKYDLDFWRQWENNPKEIERQFAPIMWIGKNDKKQTYATHIAVSKDETSKAREFIPCKLDIPYGIHPNKLMDIYGTDLPLNAPILFWVHGGYWKSGDRSFSATMARNAYSWGVRSVIIDYPFAPEAKLFEICNATCEALTKAMNIFPNSLAVIGGHSAGAQLITSLLHEIPGVSAKIPNDLKSRISGVILLSGPYDMRPVIHISVNKILQMQREEDLLNFSPLLTVDKIHPGFSNTSFLIGNAENDPPAIKEIAKMYANLLLSTGSFPSVEYKVFKDVDHFTIIDTMVHPHSDITRAMKHFILSKTQKSLSKL